MLFCLLRSWKLSYLLPINLRVCKISYNYGFFFFLLEKEEQQESHCLFYWEEIVTGFER